MSPFSQVVRIHCTYRIRCTHSRKWFIMHDANRRVQTILCTALPNFNARHFVETSTKLIKTQREAMKQTRDTLHRMPANSTFTKKNQYIL